MPIREHHQDGWDDLVEQVIKTEGVRRMKRVARAANAADGLTDGYMVSIEGDETLKRRDRATVITATAPAMAKNKKHHTLLRTFHHAGD